MKELKDIGQQRRQFLKASALGLTALAAPAIIRSANASTGIMIYTWETYHEDPWLAEWTKATGIPVRVVRAGTVDEMFANMRSGAIQPDVLWFDSGSIKRYVEAELIYPIDPSRLSNLGMITAGLKWREMNSLNGKVWGVPYNWGTQPLMYNEQVVQTPNTWQALWDKKYVGKVSMFDDGYITFPMIALAVGAHDPFNLTSTEFDRCRDALRKLRGQVKVLARGWNDAQTMYASGDAVIGYCQNISIPYNLMNQGKKFSYVFPKEGTPTWVDNAVITKRGNREEVYRFINDNLSATWQARFIKFSGNNGILSSDEARKAKLPDDLLKRTNIIDQDSPSFWPKMALFRSPESIEKRIQIWTDFKSGTL
ncbi:extracellular solute-binding protein [Paraburkholderia bannensis]|uniref:extracellular solute-binding protein n=1 Tax=Paraburkholderia bannensis TaxID=765414 RepID=UPI002AC35812|nr:extracellular solute-binding protein [Paraburkholderia bannensis]